MDSQRHGTSGGTSLRVLAHTTVTFLPLQVELASVMTKHLRATADKPTPEPQLCAATLQVDLRLGRVVHLHLLQTANQVSQWYSELSVYQNHLEHSEERVQRPRFVGVGKGLQVLTSSSRVSDIHQKLRT